MSQRILKYGGLCLIIVAILLITLKVLFGTSKLADLGLSLSGSSWTIVRTEIWASTDFVKGSASFDHGINQCVSLSILLQNLAHRPLVIDSVIVSCEESGQCINAGEISMPPERLVPGGSTQHIAVQWDCPPSGFVPNDIMLLLRQAINDRHLFVTVYSDRGNLTAKVKGFVTYDSHKTYYDLRPP